MRGIAIAEGDVLALSISAFSESSLRLFALRYVLTTAIFSRARARAAHWQLRLALPAGSRLFPRAARGTPLRVHARHPRRVRRREEHCMLAARTPALPPCGGSDGPPDGVRRGSCGGRPSLSRRSVRRERAPARLGTRRLGGRARGGGGGRGAATAG